ncbi:MAG: ABC transporter substrate-binding protein [Burkholderiales bacterium]|nr:ABC transporter substrate-binding protein [Burkholderiales bacterium]
MQPLIKESLTRLGRRFVDGLVLVAVLTTLCACDSGKDRQAAQSSAAATEIRVGHFPNITHGQALYARATGNYEKTIGVPVRWTTFNAGPTAIEALFAKSIDATYIGPNPAINGYLKSRGQEFVIVAGGVSGGAGMVVRKDAGIKQAQDFHGKTIATPQLGNTQDVAARNWFAGKGYSFKEAGGDLSILPLANPDQLSLFQTGQIHGAWTVEPWLSRLEIEGGGDLFLDEKTLWPDGRYVTTHLIIRKAFLQQQPDLARKLITAHVEATQKINVDKARATTILNEELKKETGKALPQNVIERALGRVEFTWDPIAASLYKSAESAHKIGFIKQAPDLAGIYDLRLLNEVLSEKKLEAVSDK